MDVNQYVYLFMAWLLAGFINNIVGFGAAMVAMPIIMYHVPLSVAVPGACLVVFVLNIQMGIKYRHYIDWKIFRFLIAGGVPGALIGIFILEEFSNNTLEMLLGGFLMAYALYSLLFSPGLNKKAGAAWAVPAGFFSTLFGALFSFNGPPLAVFTSFSGLKEKRAKGLLSISFIISGFIIIITQLFSGLQTMESTKFFLVSTPAVLTGGYLGIIISSFLGERSYRNIVLVLLFCAGISILIN
ncbi:MAG: sulfite exporter TauE/SafE family protein [Desulfobacterales bacterium]|nr:sulfite exporter TauE/SafE family protein [Desulfobacterales bacterium]